MVFLAFHNLLPQANSDIRNFITEGAANVAIQMLEDGPRVPPELYFNLDFTGDYIVEPPQPVVVKQVTKKRLKRKRQSVQRVRDATVQRYGHMMAMVSAAGELVSTVIIVYDRAFKVNTLTEVRGNVLRANT